MIRKVVLRNFKRFEDVTFEVPDHLVLAGPNNTGKTTLLQAIAAWAFGLAKWNELADFNRRKNGYTWQDLERLAFSAVPLRTFDLLWRDRATRGAMQIGIQLDGCPLVFLEFSFQAAGQMRVRPADDVDGKMLGLGAFNLAATFIPAMAGLAREEMELARPEAVAEHRLERQLIPHELLRDARPGVRRREAGGHLSHRLARSVPRDGEWRWR